MLLALVFLLNRQVLNEYFWVEEDLFIGVLITYWVWVEKLGDGPIRQVYQTIYQVIKCK